MVCKIINQERSAIKLINRNRISNEAEIWNEFISIVSTNDSDSLPTKLKLLSLVFWYDAEVNNNGHSGYFEYYPMVDKNELIYALIYIGANKHSDILKIACTEGINDDYIKVDTLFGELTPSLTDILMNYIITHKNDLF